MSESIQEQLRRLGVPTGTWSEGGAIDPKNIQSLRSLRTLLEGLDRALDQQIRDNTDKLVSLKEQRLGNAGSN